MANVGAGAAAGAAAGSVVPGIGTAIGALGGAVSDHAHEPLLVRDLCECIPCNRDRLAELVEVRNHPLWRNVARGVPAR